MVSGLVFVLVGFENTNFNGTDQPAVLLVVGVEDEREVNVDEDDNGRDEE